MASHLTIGKLATAAGVKVETIRYYERTGLIAPPARSEGNYRSYRHEDVTRLRFIRRTRDLGFSIEQVRSLLSISGQSDGDCSNIDALAAEHLIRIEEKINDLNILRQQLDEAILRCSGGNMTDCRVLETLNAARN